LRNAKARSAVNYAVIDHFQDIARAYLTVRRLERRYGKDTVREAYEKAFRRNTSKPPEREPVIRSFGGFDGGPGSPIRRPQSHGRLSYRQTASSEQSRLRWRGPPPITTLLPPTNVITPLIRKADRAISAGKHGRNEVSVHRRAWYSTLHECQPGRHIALAGPFHPFLLSLVVPSLPLHR
jgi:hypothetical protein